MKEGMSRMGRKGGRKEEEVERSRDDDYKGTRGQEGERQSVLDWKYFWKWYTGSLLVVPIVQ